MGQNLKKLDDSREFFPSKKLYISERELNNVRGENTYRLLEFIILILYKISNNIVYIYIPIIKLNDLKFSISHLFP